MAIFTSPTSYRLASGIGTGHAPVSSRSFGSLGYGAFTTQNAAVMAGPGLLEHETHPDIWNLVLLVFEAVMEVVCVALPGYIIARLGHFDAENQKFVANLNVMLFTPCLSMLRRKRLQNQELTIR